MSKIIRLQPKKEIISIGVIAAARMTSVRFPGKVMANLLGKPVAQWTLERAKQIRGPKNAKIKVILAVPDTPESEPLLQLATSLNIDNFCGSELNVLRRYYEAAIFFKFNYIMRITCDCPFLDPIVCSQVLQLCMWRKLDYASNVYPRRTYPKGLDCECFSFDCLEACYKLTDMLSDFEHVTPWMQRTKELLTGNVVQKVDQSEKNWCVDYPEDIERLEKEAQKNQLMLIGANENE
jgi:spore coat polysaccharide biosynthesis protein SpsF (cytidylyltransferase family)